MKLSYLVTCCNETDTLERLLTRLDTYVRGTEDEVVILLDTPPNQETLEITNKYDKSNPNIRISLHSLDRNYGAHKNYGSSLCKGDWIFQIDGDENPSEELLSSIKEVIESNPDVELIFVPRLNEYKGVNESHAKQWGWKLTYNPRPSLTDKILGPLVNWPDYQGRIYKRDTERIKWDRKLHEKIVGHNKYSFLPAEEEWALYHDKTIEKQIETNIRYNKIFSEVDNRGHNVI